MQTSSGKPRRRDVPAWLLSPPSRGAFPTTASASSSAAADGDHTVSEHPCVPLLEWWLASVEEDDQKIAVAGTFERNQTVQEFPPAPIAKRRSRTVLETEDGIVLAIHGSLNISRMRDNGFSIKVCENFMTGFPPWWQSCNLLYPKVTSSHTGGQPSSSGTSNSEVDSTKFYLERFQLGERLHSHGSSLITKLLKRFKNFTSGFSNGAPRFEEYTCDGDIATNENPAASNDDTERLQAVCSEVDNMEVDLTAGRTLRETGHGDIDSNASLVLTVECANDAGTEEAGNASTTSTNDAGNEEADTAAATSTCNQRTPVTAADEDMSTLVCLDAQHSSYLSNGIPRLEEYTCIDGIPTDEEMTTSVYLDVQNSSYLSNGTPRFEEYTCIGNIPTNEDTAALNGDSERYAAVSKEMNNMEIGLTEGSTLRGDHDVVATNVSLIPTAECSSDAVNGALYNTPPIGCKRTPTASLKSQGCRRKHQLIGLNEKPAVSPKKQRPTHEKLLGTTRSPLTRSPVPYGHFAPLTRGRTTSMSMSSPEDLKLRKTRSGRVVVPTLDAGCQRIVYDMDGSISGVVGLDHHQRTKGANQKVMEGRRGAE